ncbi:MULTISPECIES: pyruvate carboxylase [Romboutsia]|uniref:Pyruvate carboxylase n=1 Tax=Romboutsia hominis TaxID=1507512 RepID=A0A2P2BVE9_9FIRM|nr:MULTISPECIES: pyruvate carboxylase [Romboutsia]MDB8806133.1 pyruvate carboxylase [Romboutsia sp. 1001216sp1]MDB8808945.1 pyruvate carboxylase [Romboutsia sp. 1001216sp1]MDB8811810.1 pyruvate carboxylase [Romboutsia sp. 1001216sp1]MDB8817497.1 pyruvate carboxylase [Romboutsia sp. 1001216sp1]MDB8820384.1 pyruvate carboxylase [Romboutsia sp. 1001216sp1]
MFKKFNKILVANRGEIAIRIFRACSELGIKSVGIYSKEDKYSLFRTKADESYLIGEDKGPIDAYLDIDSIIELAKKKNVDAIHPGYGFLSENPEFVKKCEKNGITFIGPSADIMNMMGDKINSKRIAKEVDVATIPGIDEPIKDVKRAKEIAKEIGYPIMLKASNGGGGRGMRVVYNESDLSIEYETACSESKKAFGEDMIFIEKYIANPKHIEVQILGDKYGNIVHLYERDCSVQRRHQKIIEYSPAFSLGDKLRENICNDAVKIAKHVGYINAGTLEFLVDDSGEYYFIEMNPRVQVEHTVTEMVTGIDIVQSQILIAQGYRLDSDEINIKSQEDVKLRGYSIQCRITTEDPKNRFMPDTGKIQVYRTGSGFGIRLDGGNGFAGANISPYYDSLLVKTISWDRTFKGAINKTIRSIKEFRVRGVKTNIGFLVNVLNNPIFVEGKCSTRFIDINPELFEIRESKDRGTKLLQFIGNTVVNENKCEDKPSFDSIYQPKINKDIILNEGSRDLFNRLGKEKYMESIKNEKKLLLTDTTMRDAHQSLLATRLRTYDLLKVAKPTNEYMKDLFSIEMWGGATYDVAYRFLKESPWIRLQKLREEIPSVLFQMLFRASNGVGYKNYPDNVIEEFIKQSAEQGIDVFRIFDSLNWVENMKPSISTALETGKIVEASICYTGDILDPTKNKYNLEYYIRMAKELEELGTDIICVKDMAGLLKPYSAYTLIKELKNNVNTPIHLHTHDTSGNGIATCLMASEAGVDIVDGALETMAGLTSQPSLNAIVEALKNTERDTQINLYGYEEIGNYYKDLRKIYSRFESDLSNPSAEIYKYEIPGGQYTNLKPQADSLGLSNKFDEVKEKYKEANEILGDIIKVTPSSKVVGDLAIFMVKNKLDKNNIIEEGEKLSFPDSVLDYCKGMIGQPEGGIPKDIQRVVLKGDTPIEERPGKLIPKEDFESIKADLDKRFKMNTNIRNILSYTLYPKVYEDYLKHLQLYNDISKLDSHVYFYGLNKGEECEVEIEEGKILTIKLVDIGDVKENGNRTVSFELNGMMRDIDIKDNNYSGNIKDIIKADMNDPMQIGASIPGKVVKILVKEDDEVKQNQPMIIIEAMKMETIIVAKADGIVKSIKVEEGELVRDKQLLITMKDK